MHRPKHHTSIATRLAAVLAVILVALGITAGPASAHSVDEAVLYVSVSDEAMAGRVEFPVVTLREVFGLTLEGDDEALIAELEPSLSMLQEYAAEHLAISADGRPYAIEFTDLGLLAEGEAEQRQNFVQLEFDVLGYETNGEPEPFNGVVPRSFDVEFDPFFDELEGRSAVVLIENDVEAGVFENEEEVLLTLDPETRTRTVELDNASAWANFSASVGLGIDHIKTGPDHVLFVLVLLLPSVLVFRKEWKPQTSFGSSLWRVLKIATMFTIAHSITFTLAGLGILPLPSSKLIESVIAVSIALAALHNLRPIFPNNEWALAFGFGLFHGMGFASLVQGLDVSQKTQLVSLLGRNVGIEIGQAAVILAGFTALFVLRRTRFYLPFLYFASVAMAVISLGWMYERLAEVDLGINGIVEPALALPRAFWVTAIATAIAFGIFVMERNNDRLIPLEGDDDATEPEAERDLVSV